MRALSIDGELIPSAGRRLASPRVVHPGRRSKPWRSWSSWYRVLASSRAYHPRTGHRRLEHAPNGVSQWFQQRCGSPHPIGHGGAIQIDPSRARFCALAIERQMIRIFADQHMRQKSGAGSAPLDGPRWQRLPDISLSQQAQAMRGRTIRFTTNRPGTYSSSSVTSSTQLLQRTAAVPAVVARRQNLVMPIQMIGQRLAAMLAGGFAFFGPCGGLNLLFGSLGNLFFFRERQIELIQALGLRPKPVTVMPRKLVLKLAPLSGSAPGPHWPEVGSPTAVLRGLQV